MTLPWYVKKFSELTEAENGLSDERLLNPDGQSRRRESIAQLANDVKRLPQTIAPHEVDAKGNACPAKSRRGKNVRKEAEAKEEASSSKSLLKEKLETRLQDHKVVPLTRKLLNEYESEISKPPSKRYDASLSPPRRPILTTLNCEPSDKRKTALTVSMYYSINALSLDPSQNMTKKAMPAKSCRRLGTR